MFQVFFFPFASYSQSDSSALRRNDSLPLEIDRSPIVSSSSNNKTNNKSLEALGFSGGRNDRLLSKFSYSEIELEKGEIVSNVLKVFNSSSTIQQFSVNILYPAEWSRITSNKEYELAPGDTLFIPVILVPKKLINDNTEIVINAFILDAESKQQIGNNYFAIKTRKKVSWSVSSYPGDRFYFKNGENSKKFKINILNTGNGRQDIFVSNRVLKENLILYDTNELILKEPNYTISLDAKEDTTITYIASVTDNNKRNKKRISTNSYLPNFSQRYENYSLFVSTSEPNSFDNNTFKKSNRINFIKLPNEDRVNDFGYSYLPLIVETNVQNIFDDATFMSLNLRGFKQLNKDASLTYFSQFNYSNSYYTDNAFQNVPWYIGYYDKTKTLEAGQLNSNVIGINAVGKGLRGTYRINDQHRTSVFWVRTPGFSGEKMGDAVGLSHNFKYSNTLSLKANYGHQESSFRNTTVDAFSLQTKYNLFRKHYFNVLVASTIREDRNFSRGTRQGYLLGGNYSSSFLDRKLRSNLNARWNNREFSFGAVSRNVFNHRTIYEIDKNWSVFMANQYLKSNNYNTFTRRKQFEQEILTNTLVFSNSVKGGSVQPGLFFDYRNTQFNELLFRGLSFRYSSFSMKNNYLGSFFVRAGYSLPLRVAEQYKEEYFALQFSSILRYNVWNFSARYNYGVFSFSTIQNQNTTGVTPQNLRLALQKQYQFPNKHFILESSLTYNYNNSFKGHNFGLFPELFYFTNDGWRFSIRANYNFSSRKFSPIQSIDTVIASSFEVPERTYNNDLVVGASIRKEFGIPIPFMSKTTASLDFVTFFDVNGNGVKERNEPAIENVVIRMGGKEVLTNEEGEAKLKNVPQGSYPIFAFSLNDLQGWFPNIDDTLMVLKKGTQYIPFTRGVKVYGDVILDRQQLGVADTSKAFDLSRIKISASNNVKIYNTLTDINGRFEFYLPNGEYELTMDENILGSRYTLTRNNLPILLKDTQGGVYVSFFIVEKRKKVVRKRFGK
jgi:hypothetical protein